MNKDVKVFVSSGFRDNLDKSKLDLLVSSKITRKRVFPTNHLVETLLMIFQVRSSRLGCPTSILEILHSNFGI